jgi:hypothetical protein
MSEEKVKLSKIALLVTCVVLLVAGAAYAQPDGQDYLNRNADLSSRWQAPVDGYSGVQFNWLEGSGPNDGFASQVSFAESLDPEPLAENADPPPSVTAQTQTTVKTSPPTTTTTVTATSDDNWHLVIAPYLWLPGVHGTLGALGRDVTIDASPSDLLSHFRFGLMGSVDPSYKRLVLPLDLMWIRLGDDKALPFPNLEATTANIEATELIVTPKIGLRIVNQEKLKIDALTGFRYWHFGETMNFTPSTLGLNFSSSQNWVDPLVGGRIVMSLSPKAEVTIAGDVGGWGTEAQLDYQVVGMLGYRIKPNLALQVGYRYLDVNYRSAGTIVDFVTDGALIGVSINLK